MSPFFWYNGYQGKQYKLFPYHKAGLLRFDDPDNMCYGASGKIVMSVFDTELEKFLLLFAAQGAALSNGLTNFGKPVYTQLEDKPTKQWIDDPWDLRVITWSYDTPFEVNGDILPFEAFKIYCQYFDIRSK